MKTNTLFIVLYLICFTINAQKAPLSIRNKAHENAVEMGEFFSLSSKQIAKIEKIESNKLLAVNKYRREKKATKSKMKLAYPDLIAPFNKQQAKIIGSRSKMNKWWAYLKKRKK